jgi:murein DD-endopeptidase MepM/ murein hydrolase activator NlpD
MNTSQWQSGTVGWDTRPNKFSLGYTQPPSGGWYGVNFTNQYNLWRTGNASPLNYGFTLAPWQNNNNFDMFFSSGNPMGGHPLLYVYYTPRADDGVIKLKWPLSTPKPATPLYPFGDDWGTGRTKCVRLPMSHAGVDISNPVGNPVYVMEDGVVKEITDGTGSNFAYAIVMEHSHPTGTFTTVSWHINPSPWIVTEINAGRKPFVPKGMQIGTIAVIDGTSHLHIGIRRGAYNSTYSDKGALPTGYCSELTTFPENFINPWDTNQVLFQ